MRNSFILIFIFSAFNLLAGCSISHPQNAEEFRKAVPGASFAKTDTYLVKRSIGDVTKTFQKMAPQCLQKRVTSTSSGYMHYQVIVTDYLPTVKITAARTELHLQQDHIQGVMNVSKKPEGGYYLLVADAIPVSKNETRINLYAPSVGHDHIIKAIKGWATGQNVGCPDLTQ